jgi:hypothetical protein
MEASRYVHFFVQYIAGIFKQSLGGCEPSRNEVDVPPRQATLAGGIDSLESILELLKNFKNSGSVQ